MSPKYSSIWLDSYYHGSAREVGKLYFDDKSSKVIAFEYDPKWLEDKALCFSIDPRLPLVPGNQYPSATKGIFGIFEDASPDRWGRGLMDYREREEAKKEKRSAKTLGSFDYLAGVEDVLRMGALRLRQANGDWISKHTHPIPPLKSLSEIMESVKTYEKTGLLDFTDPWTLFLLEQGSSNGGARPKANLTQADGKIVLAKFPSYKDTYDVGLFEKIWTQMAQDCGISVPENLKTLRMGDKGSVYYAERFDRKQAQRVFFQSAMTAVGATDGEEGISYISLAENLQNNSLESFRLPNLQELFKRVVFNVLAGNRDDHLRNHGFIVTDKGLQMAPMYDVNPSPTKHTHALNLDELSPSPSLDHVIETSPYYQIDKNKAWEITKDTMKVVAQWEERARRAGASRNDIEKVRPALYPELKAEKMILGCDQVPQTATSSTKNKESERGFEL